MPKDLIPKGYANTAHGQVHYRRFAARSAARLAAEPGSSDRRRVLLIHWLPLSSRMYAEVMPALGACGHETIAVDLLGYGRSDPRPPEWSMQAWADNLAEALHALDVTQGLAVLGGHGGACVAVELALRHPRLVDAVMLDGCPFLTPELAATFAAMGRAKRPVPTADGGHESLVFRTVRTTFEHYLPGFDVTAATLERLWPAMIDYLETDFVSSAPISAAYDLAASLPRLRQPTLLLGALTDTLATHFPRACALLPSAEQHFFDGDHPLHDPVRARDYAAVLARFLATITASAAGSD